MLYCVLNKWVQFLVMGHAQDPKFIFDLRTSKKNRHSESVPSGRAVGVRHPHAVGAGVWVSGRNTVPLACMPCGPVPTHYRSYTPYSGTILVSERYYTHALLGGVGDKDVGPNDPPVKKTREHSAAKQLWPNRDLTTRFPARAWRGRAHRWRAQRGCR